MCVLGPANIFSDFCLRCPCRHTLSLSHTHAHTHTHTYKQKTPPTHTCTHTNAKAHARTHTHARTHAHTHTLVHAHTRARTHTQIHITRTHTHTVTRTYEHTNTCTYSHTKISSDAHMHTHIHTRDSSPSSNMWIALFLIGTSVKLLKYLSKTVLYGEWYLTIWHTYSHKHTHMHLVSCWSTASFDGLPQLIAFGVSFNLNLQSQSPWVSFQRNVVTETWRTGLWRNDTPNAIGCSYQK